MNKGRGHQDPSLVREVEQLRADIRALARQERSSSVMLAAALAQIKAALDNIAKALGHPHPPPHHRKVASRWETGGAFV